MYYIKTVLLKIIDSALFFLPVFFCLMIISLLIGWEIDVESDMLKFFLICEAGGLVFAGIKIFRIIRLRRKEKEVLPGGFPLTENHLLDVIKSIPKKIFRIFSSMIKFIIVGGIALLIFEKLGKSTSIGRGVGCAAVIVIVMALAIIVNRIVYTTFDENICTTCKEKNGIRNIGTELIRTYITDYVVNCVDDDTERRTREESEWIASQNRYRHYEYEEERVIGRYVYTKTYKDTEMGVYKTTYRCKRCHQLYVSTKTKPVNPLGSNPIVSERTYEYVNENWHGVRK